MIKYNVFIINNVQLKQFYQECQKDKNIAIDTEFFWTDTYQPILCLVQIANSNKVDFIFAKLMFLSITNPSI